MTKTSTRTCFSLHGIYKEIDHTSKNHYPRYNSCSHTRALLHCLKKTDTFGRKFASLDYLICVNSLMLNQKHESNYANTNAIDSSFKFFQINTTKYTYGSLLLYQRLSKKITKIQNHIFLKYASDHKQFHFLLKTKLKNWQAI